MTILGLFALSANTNPIPVPVPPPVTDNLPQGLVVPMPTLPLPSITILTFDVIEEEDAMANRLFVTSYPIDHTPLVAPPENPCTAAVGLYTVSKLLGVVVPMPTLPSIINPPVGAAVVSYPLPKLPPPLTLNIDPGAVSPMPT